MAYTPGYKASASGYVWLFRGSQGHQMLAQLYPECSIMSFVYAVGSAGPTACAHSTVKMWTDIVTAEKVKEHTAGPELWI